MIPDYVQIFDSFGNLQNKEWLTQQYGNVVVEPNQQIDSWRLVRIDEVTNGESALKVRVLDEDGAPASNNVCFSWADAPEQLQGCATQPTNNFVAQGTDGMGYTAFAMGLGSYYWPPEEGPHDVWVCSSLESDVVKHLGMLSGTNHHHLDLVFQRVKIQNPNPDPEPEPEPEPGPGGCGDVVVVSLAAIHALDNANQRMGDVIAELLKDRS